MLHLGLAQLYFVDCTRTGSLLQWFLQLTFDFSDTIDIHEDEYTNALLGRHLATRSWWAADALVDWMDSKFIAVGPTNSYSGVACENARWSYAILIHHLRPDIVCLCFNLRLQQLKILLLHWWRCIQSLSSEHNEISEMQFCLVASENARWSFANATQNASPAT